MVVACVADCERSGARDGGGLDGNCGGGTYGGDRDRGGVSSDSDGDVMQVAECERCGGGGVSGGGDRDRGGDSGGGGDKNRGGGSGGEDGNHGGGSGGDMAGMNAVMETCTRE